ncbi:hypothetical protein AC622_15290 [Bacillus sp. FJAT-27916]|mgnify:CR=1 FL=1|uniref:hypothetical protein n=1 Tax=Bacillaceae TaxID=186817 RepID=UPI0006716084|nr:hypothetical protein [Bacillus sp. FJAT-27916]KMY45419.1 hypothetical protein AC622_15290 [Bacillus sp. FJAT-27916]
MKKFYLAVTYDVCEHNDLFIDMNEYILDLTKDVEEQIKELAKVDVAPLVKVYESDTREFKEYRLYKEFIFKEYECGCEESEC